MKRETGVTNLLGGDGIAFICDDWGNILEIVRDQLGMGQRWQSGQSLTLLVDPGSRLKVLSFLLELRTEKAAFDWELNVSVNDRIQSLYFGGGVYNDHYLVIAASSRDKVVELYDDMMRITNEQTNTLRSVIKEQVIMAQTNQQRDSFIYDEISRLNNELVTLQRELAKKNAEQRVLNKELKRLDNLKNTFLGVAAHDLRSPMANVSLTAEFLLDAWGTLPEADVEKLIQSIARQTEYMLALVKDLLDVSKIETGNFDLDLTPIDTGLFVSEAIGRHLILAGKKGIRLVLKEISLGTTLADPIRIRQVIDNLISNALKFSPKGSVVNVLTELDSKEWRLSVQDEGPGISIEEQTQLFQYFSRVSPRPTDNEESTGLGLAISRRIVEAHKGTIGVDSILGQGATFWFSLPVDQ